MKTVEAPYDWVTDDFRLKQERSLEEMSGDTKKASSAAAYSWIVKGRITEGLAGSPTGLVLNVGCGWGRELTHFQNAVGIDLCLPYLKTARNYTSHDYVLADAEHLPFKTETFSFTSSAEVIEHLQNPQQAIDEMHRVLINGGRIVLQTPNVNLTRGKAIAENYKHRKEFTKKELVALLDEKFKIVKVTGSTIPYIPTKNQFYWLNWNPLFLAFWKCLNRLLPFKWDIIICGEKIGCS